ncbi:MAG TPA: ABC transporter ATP-binding protein [Kaistia sp.]|nr:ABC transporter ATP-binding protein [Kaistia sp.]
MSLVLDDLSVGYGRRTVLQNVDLVVEPGTVLALLGENGAGKSSLIKAIAGVVRPRTGSIAYAGTDLSRLDRRLRARVVSYVPQRGPDVYGLNVREAVLLGRNPYFGISPTRADHDAVDGALRRLGLGDLAERQVMDLSGGQAQRVLIARALAQQSDVLLLDEPTSALDLRYQVDVLRLIRDLTHEHRKVSLIAIHDLNLAARFCDAFVFVHQGRVSHRGGIETAYTAEAISEVYGLDVAVDISPDGYSVRPLLHPGERSLQHRTPS